MAESRSEKRSGDVLQRLSTTVGLVALLVGLPVLFFALYEKRVVEGDPGPSPEAEANPYLAAERLLEGAGIEVRRFEQFGLLPRTPPTDATLWLSSSRRSVSEERARELLEWVAAGGHLMLVGGSDPDRMLDQVGLTAEWVRVRELLSDPLDESESAPPVAGRDRVEVELPGRDEPLTAEFGAAQSWQGEALTTASWTARGPEGVHVVHLERGQGGITALTDSSFMKTPYASSQSSDIGRFDHAELFYELATQGGTVRTVWHVTGDEWLSPFQLVRMYAWRIVLSLGVLLLAWIVAVMPAMGPRVPDPSARRRALMEHVAASGRFLWKRGGRGALLDAVRAAVLDRVRKRHPGWERLASDELHQRLAESSGLPPDHVARAFGGPEPRTPESFVSVVRTLHQVSRAL